MNGKDVLKRFFREKFWRYFFGFLVLLVTGFLAVLIPKLLGQITDGLAKGAGTDYLIRTATLMVGVALSVFGLKFVWRILLQGGSRAVEVYLRDRLFEKLQTLPVSFYQERSTGDLVAVAISDVQAVRQLFGPGLLQALDGTVTGIFAISAMAGTISPALTLLCLAPLPFSILLVLRMRKPIRDRYQRVQETFAAVSARVQEDIAGVRVLKSFAREELSSKVLVATSETRVKAQVSLVRMSGLLGPGVQLCFGASFLAFIILGSRLVANGSITIGDFVAFNVYTLTIMAPVANVAKIVDFMQKGLASFRRLDIIFRAEASPGHRSADAVSLDYSQKASAQAEERLEHAKEAAREGFVVATEEDGFDDVELMRPSAGYSHHGHDGSNALAENGNNIADSGIIIRNLTFSYPGALRPALRAFDLTVPSGSTLGIIGRTGSGKTTLINVLLRLFPVPDGTVFVGGTDLNRIETGELRERIGCVPQDSFLFSTTIRDNIEFFRPLYSDEDIEDAARLAEVHGTIISFPEGFGTMVGERGVTLSGGQKQRISIARALIKEPDILILDDSLSAVDAATEETILGNIRGVLDGRTGIVISHRVSTLQHLDQVILIADGRIVERGNPRELMEGDGPFATLAWAQAEDRARLAEKPAQAANTKTGTREVL